MKRVEIAKHFGVSRATVQDWQRRGCPVDGDVGDVASWRMKQSLEVDGLREMPLDRLPNLVGELARRRLSLEERIRELNELPPNSNIKNDVKVAVCFALLLERELLGLPAALLAEARPDTVPEKICELVLAAIDRVREEDEDPDSK